MAAQFQQQVDAILDVVRPVIADVTAQIPPEVTEQVDVFRAKANEYGEIALKLANPDIDRSLHPGPNWPLMKADEAVLTALAYLAFVFIVPLFLKLIFGSAIPQPALGKDGKPKKYTVLQKWWNEPVLFPLMLIYNAVQVALCAYMVRESVLHYMEQDYILVCNKFSLQAKGRLVSVLWVFYVSKVLDFADTFFMVFRRKWNQLSFLHVYHHTTIFLVYWVNMNVAYDGDIYYTIVANGFIHFIMYFYYLVTTLNFKVPQIVKKAVTNLQLIQFVTMNIQAFVVLYWKCPFPNNFTWFYLFYIQSLFWLFQNFKSKTYKTPKTDGKKKTQ